MNYQVLDRLKVKTPDGIRELQEVISELMGDMEV